MHEVNINIKQTGDHKEEINHYNFKTSKVQETLGNLSQNHDKKYSNCLPETPLKDLAVMHLKVCMSLSVVTETGPKSTQCRDLGSLILAAD